MLTIFKGATFQATGVVMLDGVQQDCSGWNLTANVYDVQGINTIAMLTVTWLNQATGLLSLTASDTSLWPAGKARIDMRVDTGNEIILSPPEYIRIQESPLS